MWKFMMIAAGCVVAVLAGAEARADTYMKTRTGYVTPKHECSTSPCVDCTFLDYQTCYQQGDKLGLIDKNVGFGRGQRPPLRLDRAEEPLEAECSRSWNNNTTSYHLAYGNGQIVCPVPGAVVVEAPPKPTRVVEAWLPDESPGGEAAVGIFFAQNCPGYITQAARETIHTFAQFRAREAWGPYREIQTNIVDAAKANHTSVQKELYLWCIAAEPRIFAIQEKLGQALR